ncbi:HNH endonuclease [Chryseobacterium sp.]|uniref:HNH endonuclease n=1 Tax=Chryseobacterium sp. TaxID=1871047 RepID=UPI002FC68F46
MNINNFQNLDLEEYFKTDLKVKDLYRIRFRDNFSCRICDKSVKDNLNLTVTFKCPINLEGKTYDSNLWTLCNECVYIHKNFFGKNLNPKIIEKVFSEKTGSKRLKVLFYNLPNKNISSNILESIAGIKNWKKAIRKLKNKDNLDILWISQNNIFEKGYYIFKTKEN